MLSYKEYKLLNESLYGAFNLGLRSQGTVGGIVSQSGLNGTEAAIEAQAEEAIEEAKKMKKKMEGDDEEKDEEEDEVVDNPKTEDDDEDSDEEDDDEESDEEDDDDEDEEEESDEEEKDEKKDFSFMKKKSKKEWSEVMSDLEDLLEVVDDEEALTEVKKGLEMMKKGMEKGMKKHMDGGCKKCGKYMSEGKKHHAKNHKPDCDCPVCTKKHDEKDGDEGLTAGQKKLPKALQDAILAKKGKGEKKCGKMMDKKMNEDEQAWWNSVNDMLGTDDQKGWDGWTEVGEVQQAVRSSEVNESILGAIGTGIENLASNIGADVQGVKRYFGTKGEQGDPRYVLALKDLIRQYRRMSNSGKDTSHILDGIVDAVYHLQWSKEFHDELKYELEMARFKESDVQYMVNTTMGKDIKNYNMLDLV
jgi:hypothetical protein